MKIAQVAPYFPYEEHFNGVTLCSYHVGGVERHVWELSKRLVEEGQEVDVITSGLGNSITSEVLDSIRIYRLPINFQAYTMPISSMLFPFLIQRLKRMRIDVVHAHTPTAFYSDLAALACRIRKVPFIVTLHNDIIRRGVVGKLLSGMYNLLLSDFQFKIAKKIIVSTQTYVKSSETLHKRFLDNIAVIPNAVDVSRFRPQNKYKAKRKLHYEGKKIVLYVGYLGHYKGASFLIKAIYRLKQLRNLHLVLVGEGPLKNYLKDQASKLGVLGKVTFTGYVKDFVLPLYYSAADVFVLPSISREEGFGIVQLEAMACGTPVITTSIPGVMEVASGVNSAVQPRDSIALAKAILNVLEDEELARCMATEGRRLVERKYSWGVVAPKILELYKEIS